MNKNKSKFITVLVVIFGVFFAINALEAYNKNKKSNEFSHVNYTKFLSDVETKKIKSVIITEKNSGPREIKVVPTEGKSFSLNAPQDDVLVSKLRENKVDIEVIPEAPQSFFVIFFFSYGPIILFIFALIYIMKKMQNGKSMFQQIGKNKGKLIDPANITVSFKDIVGCDEAKEEIQEFVSFLQNPERYSKLGGRIPRGVLLTGPSGTGKTLLAKALAKESGVSFLSLSGSDFVEMFVGVGASRVRDLFETAKKHSPCVIFIDEIDAIGAARSNSGTGGGGGHDEREQTLNQILVELDGFETDKGVILVAATNRPDILDKALLRPGRLDRKIEVGLPDVNGREEILKIHVNNNEVPLSNNADLAKISRGTVGFSGAQLANLINEAALISAKNNKKFVGQEELEKAKDKIMMGVERPSLAMSLSDKKDTAYHESGHVVVAKLLPNADPVYKVTVIPRGRALGLTMQLPEEDKFSYKAEYLKDKITILMGGRAAEELFCHTRTNGASNDISVATNIARSMITEWGMSDLGPIAFGNREQSFLNNGGLNTSGLSQHTLQLVEKSIHDLINDEYAHAKKLLSDNADIVEAMTQALMEVETLDDWQIENLMKRMPFNDHAGFIDFNDKFEARSKEIANNRKKIEPEIKLPFVVDTI